MQGWMTQINLMAMANILVSILLGRLVQKRTGLTVIWTFEIIHILFFGLKPIVMGTIGITYPYLIGMIDDKAIKSFELIGLLFLLGFHLTLIGLFSRKHSHQFLENLLNFDYLNWGEILKLVLVFTLISYIANVIKFHSPFYFLKNDADSFGAMMNLAKGGWFIQSLSSALFFPLLVISSKIMKKSILKNEFFIFLAMVLFWVICRPSVRTPILGAGLAVFFMQIMRKDFRLTPTRFLFGAVAFLFVIFLTNWLRQGGGDNISDLTVVGFLFSVANNLNPADNGVALVAYVNPKNWVWFKYFIITATPINIIPRAIFPWKPSGEIQSFMTDRMFGGSLDLTYFQEGSTLTYTMPALAYANMGYISVIIVSIVYGFIIYAFMRCAKSGTNSASLIAFYTIVKLMASYRTGIEPVFTDLYVMAILIFGMKLVTVRRTFI